MPRLFTLAEAEALLPTVIPILEAIRDARRELSQAEEEIGRRLAPLRGNGHRVGSEALQRLRREAARAAQALQARASELEALDVELKDPDSGLIDFRSDRDGRVVYLCWRLGEPRIDWWHELEAGFAGRQPLARDD
ncbi:MAG TPA: DUF2203 domain-containing protein [Chloroflexota bacterium]